MIVHWFPYPLGDALDWAGAEEVHALPLLAENRSLTYRYQLVVVKVNAGPSIQKTAVA